MWQIFYLLLLHMCLLHLCACPLIYVLASLCREDLVADDMSRINLLEEEIDEEGLSGGEEPVSPSQVEQESRGMSFVRVSPCLCFIG